MLSYGWSLDQLFICWSIWHPCSSGGFGEIAFSSRHAILFVSYSELFAIELVHFTISCSNSTWATGFKVVSLQSRFAASLFAATRVDSLHTQSRFAKHLRSFRFKLHKPKSRFATLSLPHLNSRNFREYRSVASFSNVKLLRFDR